ncbi:MULTISPECIES: hypothetical protein [unclassified Streptomyces]|uniref:hypothetical protein n=1 Tax=unclassified Streptomyces TaxID=2593676 RepID=UPI00226FD761|nr:MULTISPECIES: hypothetical protein [unclassified Streptomyces]MCY0922560.1 hypothetical protein [Streptomyces sp. H27-G5]MCY0962638.1 hypothetical protein [Streptomyces sp. H27-H5]
MANHLSQIAARLADVERRLTGQTRTASLAYSSVEAGAIEVYDEDGVLTGTVGVQVDGTTGVATFNGPPPPTPTAPQVVPVLGGLRIGWDGAFTDASAAPLNLGRVQVHLLLAADEQIDVRSPAATIEAASGATVTIAVSDYVPRHVRLVALSTAGIPGPVSAAVVAAARQAVGQDLLDGIVSEIKLAEKAVTDTKIAVGAVGTAALADGAVLADKLAKAAVTSDKIGAGAVTLNALGGALADGITQHYVDALGDPAAWTPVTIGAGAKWEHLTGVADAPTGRTVGQATGYTVVRGTTPIPYDPDTLYRVSARIRTVSPSDSGTDNMYVGVMGFGADGKTIVNRVDANSISSHYYCAASRTPLPAGSGWQVFTGYLRGRAASGASGTAGVCADPRAPGKLHDQVRFVVPYLYLNYESNPTGAVSGTGVMQVDAVTVEILKTGIVDSSNLVAGSVTTGALATDSVTAGKVAADTITGRELQAASVSAGHVVAGAITTDKMTVVGTANVLADPSFEGAPTASLTASVPYATQDKTRGNGSPSSLRIDAVSATPVYRAVDLTLLPATPGDQLYLACDYFASEDWAGAEVSFHIRWEAADGKILGYGKARTTSPVRGQWARVSGTYAAPDGAVRARVRVESGNSTAGTLWWDNACVRPIVAGVQIADGAITAPKVYAGAITTDKLAALTVTADKIAASAITADKVAALSITAEKLAANSVTASAIAAGAIEAIHIKAGSISADKIALGLDGNMVADSSFEGEVALKRVAATGGWSIVSPGRDTAKALRADCTAATATDRVHTLGVFAATPGTRVWMAADYQVSADWVGKRAQVYIRWEDAQGGTLGYSRVISAAGAAGKGWLFMSGTAPEPAPAQTAVGRMRLAVDAGTAGTVTFDNVVIRTVVSSGTPGGRAEISPEGVRLFDADGEESISLVTGKPQYLTITNDSVPVATINENGHASFNDLSVAGQLTIKGERLETQLVDLARGVVAIHSTAQGVEAAMGAETGYIELPVRIEADRQYRIVVDAYLDPSAGGGELILFLRDGGTGAPSVTSRQVQSFIAPAGGGWQRVRLEHTCSGSSLGAGTHRLLSTFQWRWGAAGGTVSMFGGAEFPACMYVEDVGKAIASTGELNRGTGGGGGTDPSKPATQRYEKTYGASWSGTYTSRSGYSSYHANQMLQGYYSSTNGTTASLVGFPPALTSDLAGAKIEKVMLYLYFEHWYNAAGGSAVIKPHGHTSRPGSFSSDGQSMTVSWRRNEGKWVDVTSLFDASKKGIALDPNSTNSTYYGRAHGVGQQYPPQLKVIYVK